MTRYFHLNDTDPYASKVFSEGMTNQRILASLAQKEVTQATILRKLACYTRQNQTKKALWEPENIFQSIHILDFIDDHSYRQHIQKALNRGKAYHRMRLAAGDQDAVEFLKGVSPVAWRNINLIGNIKFAEDPSKIDIEALADRFNDPNFWRKSLKDGEDSLPIE